MGRKEDKERREAIKRLQSDIEGLNGIIDRLQDIKHSYNECKRQINTALEEWDMQYRIYCDMDLAPDIMMVNSFEGTAAEQLAIEVPQVIEGILSASGQMAAVLSGIEDQILKIDEYIDELKAQKAELLEQLAALL